MEMLKNGLAYVIVNIQRSKAIEVCGQLRARGRIEFIEPAAAIAVEE